MTRDDIADLTQKALDEYIDDAGCAPGDIDTYDASDNIVA